MKRNKSGVTENSIEPFCTVEYFSVGRLRLIHGGIHIFNPVTKTHYLKYIRYKLGYFVTQDDLWEMKILTNINVQGLDCTMGDGFTEMYVEAHTQVHEQ